MNNYIDEVDNNFDRFFISASNDVANVTLQLNTKKDRFKDSYRRLVSLQAWRSEIIDRTIDSKASEFFKEAQNDALMSHSLARQGAWRVALMSLRSCVENILFGLYYCDHSVELEQWDSGEHKLGFTEVASYLNRHPMFKPFTEQQTGIEGIKTEYSTLSKAVHGSSRLFRMTKAGAIEGLNIHSEPDLGAWLTRERSTLSFLNRILIVFFRDDLQGASNQNLRKAISLVIPESKHAEITSQYGVKLKSVA
ncbi:MAG: hypothetical protein AB1Y36_11530 [Cycloclasticus sp.]